MSLLRPASLRRRLMFIAMAVTLLALLSAAGLFMVNDVRMMRAQMVRDLEVLAEVVGDNCLSALMFDAPETAERNLASLRREYQIRYAILYDAEGRVFARYQRNPGQTLEDARVTGEGAFVNFSLPGTGTVDVLQELTLDGQVIGRVFIRAGMDELAAHLRHYARMVGILFSVTLLVSLLLALRLQRQVSEPILDLAAKAREISEEGDYSLRAEPPRIDDEIADLFHGFNAMLEQIEARDRSLNRIRADLEEANAKLRGLAKEISLISEQEKKRLAGELHDSPMQKLALAQAQIASAAKRRDTESRSLLAVALELVREALQELRTLQFDLSPPILHQEGLAAALGWLASSVAQRFGVEFSFVKGDSLPPIDQDVAVVLFQCARELVHNVVRHAEASLGAIGLHFRDGEVLLVVSDNGKGLSHSGHETAAGQMSGYGLFSVRERLALLGGDLSVESDDTGTRASARVPLAPKTAERFHG
jgi:signal transduction histidine kinase